MAMEAGAMRAPRSVMIFGGCFALAKRRNGNARRKMVVAPVASVRRIR